MDFRSSGTLGATRSLIFPSLGIKWRPWTCVATVVHLALTPGEAHDNRLCSVLLSALLPQTMLLAYRGYDADWIRELVRQQGAWGKHSAETQAQRPDLLQPLSLSCTQPDRTVLQQDQTMSGCRNPIRQTRSQLSSVRQACINPHLVAC
jgi:transposase